MSHRWSRIDSRGRCRAILLLLAGLLAGAAPAPGSGTSPAEETRDASRHLGGLEGAFVLLKGDSGARIRHNPERSAARFIPASTFKIPNALIALETGVADGADFRLAWDPRRDPAREGWPAAWKGDQTLRSAMRDSVVWYFQEIARRIGRPRMQAFVDRFGYGSRELGEKIDEFWLEGPLEISADQQVEFLRRFHAGDLGASARATGMVKEILVLEEGPGYRLSGKTGTARGAEGRWIAWLVGYVERGREADFYALNLDCPDYAAGDSPRRRQMVRAVLADWGALPAGGEGRPAGKGAQR